MKIINDINIEKLRKAFKEQTGLEYYESVFLYNSFLHSIDSLVDQEYKFVFNMQKNSIWNKSKKK